MKITEHNCQNLSLLGLTLTLAALLTGGMFFAQNAKAADEPRITDAPAVSTPTAQAAAPKLPAYFTGTNDDPKKPAWPDPTGTATGVWATPAGDGKGDIPDQLKINDLY